MTSTLVPKRPKNDLLVMSLLPKHVFRNSPPNRFPVKSQIVGLCWFLGTVARSKEVTVGIPHLPQANSKHWPRNQSWHRHSQGNLDLERPASHNRPDPAYLVAPQAKPTKTSMYKIGAFPGNDVLAEQTNNNNYYRKKEAVTAQPKNPDTGNWGGGPERQRCDCMSALTWRRSLLIVL